MELISKLGIDWKLLIAQIINFGILLLILYKFVYGPVLKVLHERQKKIEKGLEDSKKSEALLLQIEEIQQQRRQETEQEVGRILDRAMKEAAQMKQDLVKEAQAQSEEIVKRARLQAEEMKTNIVKEVKREMAQLILIALQKVLEREFSEADQRRLEDSIRPLL